tara:strand:- start:1119 stop:1916 length:798 start_codon:yes stop_codon:yes gene_type:complete
MKKIYEKIKNKLILKTIPHVETFKEADLYCKNRSKLGYESKLLSKYRFDKLDKYIKNYGQTPFTESSNLLIYCIAYYLKNNAGKFPKIVDFGGACGENILFLSSIFGNDILKSAWIVETKTQVDFSNKYDFSKKLNFSNDLKKILIEKNIDIFFSSCALNYIENPYEILSMIKDLKISIVSLTRNNFSINPKSFVQVSNLSDNGFGIHIEQYGNPRVWYPSQSLSEEKIKNIFSRYQLLLDISVNKSGIINKNENYAKDLIFNIK